MSSSLLTSSLTLGSYTFSGLSNTSSTVGSSSNYYIATRYWVDNLVSSSTSSGASVSVYTSGTVTASVGDIVLLSTSGSTYPTIASGTWAGITILGRRMSSDSDTYYQIYDLYGTASTSSPTSGNWTSSSYYGVKILTRIS